jgi:hypothetical protein
VPQDFLEAGVLGPHGSSAALAESEAMTQAAAAQYHRIAFPVSGEVVARDRAPAEAASDLKA